MDTLGGKEKVPVPDRADIISWLVNSWESISSESIVKTFASIGYGVQQTDSGLNQDDQQGQSVPGEEGEDEEIDLSDLVLHVRL